MARIKSKYERDEKARCIFDELGIDHLGTIALYDSSISANAWYALSHSD